MSYINQTFALQDSATEVINLDRWSYPAFTLQLDSGTSVLVEGTLSQVNRDPAVVWHTINDLAGMALTAAAQGITGIEPIPYEAIRITATGVCVGRLMQTGSE